MDVEPLVFLISSDSKARRALACRVKELGYESRPCPSLQDFLQSFLERPSAARDGACILYHVAQEEIDQNWLSPLGNCEDHWPVIGMAASADVEAAVRAMKAGAFDFLLESCPAERLRAALEEALRWVAAHREHVGYVQSIRRRLKQLAQPQRDVLELLLRGKSNREIAAELGMSVRSIEVRRAKIMSTMKTQTLAALVRKALLAGAVGPSHRAGPTGELNSVRPLA